MIFFALLRAGQSAEHGRRLCDEGYTGSDCETCASGYYPDIDGACCLYEACLLCDLTTLECRACNEGYTGSDCSECEGGYEDSQGTCCFSDAGHCAVCPSTDDACEECLEGYAGSLCEECADEFYPDHYGNCCQVKNCGDCRTAQDECVACKGGYAGDECRDCDSDFYRDNDECKYQAQIAPFFLLLVVGLVVLALILYVVLRSCLKLSDEVRALYEAQRSDLY